jgi:peptidoglycan hydrolase CwlO-like protein
MRNHEKRLNFKFWFKRKQCFSCVLKEEQEIKNQGPDAWLRYEQRIMLENAESWFKDADKEVEILKQQVYETYWQNADGERGEIDISEYIKKIEEDYESLKTNIRNQFGNEQ